MTTIKLDPGAALLLDALHDVRQALPDLLSYLLNCLFLIVRQFKTALQGVRAAAVDFDELFLPKDLLFRDQSGTSGEVPLCRVIIAGRI